MEAMTVQGFICFAQRYERGALQWQLGFEAVEFAG